MVIRWKAHRYLLGQSLVFYQDEFAGRVATKMMQTALGVRETCQDPRRVVYVASISPVRWCSSARSISG
jgi:hypothetical protein